MSKWTDLAELHEKNEEYQRGYKQAALEYAVSQAILDWLMLWDDLPQYRDMTGDVPRLSGALVDIMQERLNQNYLEMVGKATMQQPPDGTPVEQMTPEQLRYIGKYGYKTSDPHTGPWTWEWYDTNRQSWTHQDAAIWRDIVTEAVGPRIP